MNGQRVHDLSDCTEYRQTLLAQPPRFVHATVILLIALVLTAVLWAAWTQADLVVRAKGRVRPMIRTGQLADAAAEESQISPLRAGRVIEVHVREGQEVRQGDLLIRLDTERLDNDLAKQRRSIRAAEDQLDQLDQLAALVKHRFETAKAKAEAELAEARQQIRRATQRQSSEARIAKGRLELAADELRRVEKLSLSRVISEAEVVQARARFREAELELESAQLPVDEGKVLVFQQVLQLVEKEYSVEWAELEGKQQLKRAEVEAAQFQLSNLELERRQSELCAPADGTVTALNVKVGDVLQTGQQVLAVAEQRGFRIDVAVTSDDVGQLRVGMPARIKLDAYDYQRYGTVVGTVIFVAPDSEFGGDLTTVEGPTYTVKIALATEQVQCGRRIGRIRLGMTGWAEIVADRECLLSLLVRSLRQSISLG